VSRWDRITVYLAYILLVGVVVWMVVWLEGEADQAQQERCELFLVELTVLDQIGELPAQLQADVDELLKEVCA
jgi:hypothetical protein